MYTRLFPLLSTGPRHFWRAAEENSGLFSFPNVRITKLVILQGNGRVFFQALLAIFTSVSDADHLKNTLPKISILFLENLYEKRVDFPCSP